MYYAFASVKPKTSMKLICLGVEEKVFVIILLLIARMKCCMVFVFAIHPTNAEELVTI